MGRERRAGDEGRIDDCSRDVQRFAREVQELATAGTPRFDFLRDVASRIRELAGCSLVGLVVRGSRHWYVGRLAEGWTLTTVPGSEPVAKLARTVGVDGGWTQEELRCWDAILERAGRRFWAGREPAACTAPDGSRVEAAVLSPGGEAQGGLMLVWPRGDAVSRGGGVSLAVARPLATAILYHRAQAALRERVKELTGLYELSKLTEATDRDPEEVLQRVAELLPPAWQYPEIATGRVELDGRRWTAGAAGSVVAWQEAPILVKGVARGRLGVGYTSVRPELDEGPFLREERYLIDALARETGLFLERWETRREQKLLEEQLRHADRLATIGQLAAGVAHELNEPLAAILGFAQLSLEEDVPESVRSDLSRIAKASLHAREVIKKLMLFARQTPPRREALDINRLVEESLYFLESRCTKQGIEVKRAFDGGLPAVEVDPGQIQQVVVNLVVNAIQAMPEGGTVTLRTCRHEDAVCLEVEDTGCGIPEAIRDRLFLPFFTTKDADRGTGLGLAVVHGIVTAHGGTIEVSSVVGQGSRFRVVLPVAEDED